MKRSTRTLAALLGSALLLATAGAFAFGGHRGGPDCDGDGALRAVYALPDLTDQQRQKLDVLRKEERTTLRARMDAMRNGHRQLKDAMEDGADSAAIEKIAKQQGAQLADFIIATADARRRVDAILTDQQRQELRRNPPAGGPAGDGPMGRGPMW